MSEDGELTAALLVVLRERMGEQGLSETTLADRVNMKQQTLNRRLSGAGTLTVDHWEALAHAIGARDLEELLGEARRKL